MSVRVIAVAALIASALSAPAGAGTATGTFTVQATISSACLVAATTLNFGTYNPASATALTATSTVSVNCTSGSPYTAALNVGSGGGSFGGRTMLNGSSALDFNLYRDAAYSQVWGDGTGSTFTGTGSGLLTANNITVYGQVPVSQDKVVAAVMPVAASQSQVFQLLLAAGVFVPPGAEIQLNGRSLPVGTEGLTQVPLTRAAAEALVSWPGGRCRFRVPAASGLAPATGPVAMACGKPGGPVGQPGGPMGQP